MPAGTSQPKAPVRMGKRFAQMLVDCPLDIQVYGACVANLTGGVDRFACDREFRKLRECFQRVAKAKRTQSHLIFMFLYREIPKWVPAKKHQKNARADGYIRLKRVLAMRPPVRHGDAASVFVRPCTANRSFSSGAPDGSSSSSGEEEDVDDDDGEDADLPSDAASLEDEFARVQETIQRLEEGTDDDFVLGCEMLLASKQSNVTRAYANFERFKSTAIQLYEYECEQAKVRYRARCAQLQDEMREEFDREIQRLKNTRDGVSVMDRRRLTRNSGGMDEKSKSRQGTSTASSELHPTAGNNGSGSLHNAFSAAEEAHRVQYEEKKRLEVLLSKTPVFQQLNQRVDSEDVSQDLATITQAVQARRRVRHQSHSATGKDGSANVVAASHSAKNDACRPDNGARRLAYNPAMLQEGDNVVVYRVHKCPSDGDGQEAKQSRCPEDEDTADEELHSSREQVMAGVITASTLTHVFLLQPNGKFDTIEVGDWKANRIEIRAVSTKRKR